MAANFGMAARGPGVAPGDWAKLAAAVPEPATGLLVLATLPLLRRRRNVLAASAARHRPTRR
jgi:hypothetical protein